jgi:hypothetical protein
VGLSDIELTRCRHPLELIPEGIKKASEHDVLSFLSSQGIARRIKLDAASASDPCETPAPKPQKAKAALWSSAHLLR